MALDELDTTLLQLVLEDADRSLRELAEAAGTTAPTVSSRLSRLEDLGILGPARRDVALAKLGTLVLILAPPGDLEDLADHELVFEVHRTQTNRAMALAVLPEEDLSALHEAFPQAETHVLTEEVRKGAPTVPTGAGKVPCAECGKPVEEDGLDLTLGGKRYVVCCPSCKTLLEQRYERHELGT